MLEQPIFLIGFPGSGKTTLGRALHAATGVAFTDLDEAIEARGGMSVREIFARHGEAYFRELESAELRRCAGAGGAVVACGGGTPCRAENMELMNKAGVTVWLEAPAACLVERLSAASAQRPLIAGKSDAEIAEYVEHVMREREGHYAKASARFDASRLDDAAQIEESVRRFRARFMGEA